MKKYILFFVVICYSTYTTVAQSDNKLRFGFSLGVGGSNILRPYSNGNQFRSATQICLSVEKLEKLFSIKASIGIETKGTYNSFLRERIVLAYPFMLKVQAQNYIKPIKAYPYYGIYYGYANNMNIYTVKNCDFGISLGIKVNLIQLPKFLVQVDLNTTSSILSIGYDFTGYNFAVLGSLNFVLNRPASGKVVKIGN